MEFGIRSKLYVSFGALVLLSGVAAEYSIFSLGDVGSHIRTMVELSEKNARAELINNDLEAIQRAAARYRSYADEESIAQWTAKEYKVTSLLKGDLAVRLSEDRERFDNRLLNILSSLKPAKSRFAALGISINASRAKLSDAGDDVAMKSSKLAMILRASDASLQREASEFEGSALTIAKTNLRYILALEQG